MHKKVYILGAGASHDLSFRIGTHDAGWGTYLYKDFHVGPLSSGYFYYFNQIQKAVKESTSHCASVAIGRRLLKYVSQKYDITENELLDDKDLSLKVNIENLYIAIEETADEMELRDLKFQELFAVQLELRSYILNTLSFVGYYCISKFHHSFADYLVNTGGDVISFNWDTLLDEAMFDTGRWSYETGYGFGFEKAIYKSNDHRKNTPIQDSKTTILKPHGSINWYSDNDNKEEMYLVLPVELRLRGGTFGQLRPCESIGDKSVFTHIVPPGKKRKYFPRVWERMRDVLQNADKIIAIGFSFNGNDSHVKEEFENIQFKRDLSIEIINPNGVLLLGTYKEVFKTENVVVRSSSFAQYCDEISSEVILGE